MNNDETGAVYAAIETCSWREAQKIATACHVLSARLGNLSREPHTDQLSEKFNAFAVRAEIVLAEKIFDKGLDIQD